MDKAKGHYNGLCNRTDCQSPVHVVYFNHSTRKYYCPSCAHLINDANHFDSLEMFGHDLCTLDIEGKNYYD